MTNPDPPTVVYGRVSSSDSGNSTYVLSGVPIELQSVFLAEYKQLKDEQRSRISVRDNLIYATLTSIAAVLLFAFNGVDHRSALLLLPPVCLVLGWTYLINDEKVTAIGRYIRDDLAPRLAGAEAVLGWESTHRSDARRSERKFIQAIIDILLFCGTGIAAVIVCWTIVPVLPTLLLGVGSVEIIALFFLAFQIVVYAELGVRSP